MTETKMTPAQSAEPISDKAAAALYRAIRQVLPEVLYRGALSALESTPPTEGSGLSWSNLPADELLKIDSESAQIERLRRSVQALEQWNLRCGLNDAYAPTAQLLSTLASADEATAEQWLQRPSVRAEMQGYLQRLRLDGANAQQLADFNQVRPNGEPKPPARSLINWEAISVPQNTVQTVVKVSAGSAIAEFNRLGGIITAATAAGNLLAGGITKGLELAGAGIAKLAGGFAEVAAMQSANIGTAGDFARLTGKSFADSQDQIDGFGERMSKVAADLPGQNDLYKQIGLGITDNLVPAFQDASRRTQ